MSLKQARILWPQLGWRPGPNGRAPSFSEGKVAFLVVAPWCPDCRELGPKAHGEAPKDRPVWLVGEFGPEEEVSAFAREFGLGDWPLLLGTSAKDEPSRNEARFRHIREAFGDPRRWGVPLWIEGEIENGWLAATRVRWPE
jgi:hypothetical protein